MRLFGFGGTDLARCLPLRFAREGSARCAHIQIGSGLGELFVKINGETHSLWRAVDQGFWLFCLVAKWRLISVKISVFFDPVLNP
jgi:hypothetical protein